MILDCKAVNENEDYVEPTVRALTSVLGIEEGEIRTRLTAESTKNSQYQIIKKQISMDDKKAFEDYNPFLRKVIFRKSRSRKKIMYRAYGLKRII